MSNWQQIIPRARKREEPSSRMNERPAHFCGTIHHKWQTRTQRMLPVWAPQFSSFCHGVTQRCPHARSHWSAAQMAASDWRMRWDLVRVSQSHFCVKIIEPSESCDWWAWHFPGHVTSHLSRVTRSLCHVCYTCTKLFHTLTQNPSPQSWPPHWPRLHLGLWLVISSNAGLWLAEDGVWPLITHSRVRGSEFCEFCEMPEFPGAWWPRHSWAL